jgi:hypothetical protein
MKSFGKRIVTAMAPSAPPSSASPPRFARVALAAIALSAAFTAVFVWRFILRVPLERPVGPLFGNALPPEGWAAWYVAPLVAFALTLGLFHLYFRKSRRWTVLGLTLAGAIAILVGSTVAFWVKNIGYTWYSVPGASIVDIGGALVPMLAFAFGRGAYALNGFAPLSFPIGALFGTVVALCLKLPWWSPAVAVEASARTPVQAAAPEPKAGMVGRLATTALMTLFVTMATTAEIRSGAVKVAPLMALIWWFLSFRAGEYAFINALKGSAVLSLISTLPFFLAPAATPVWDWLTIGGQGLNPAVLALGFFVRMPVYLLVSVILIKIALVLSKATGEVAARPRTAGRP